MNFKRLITVTALLCASFAIGQAVKPLVQPHWSFVDASGAPCAGCTLTTYLAGTTTATPTYTDVSGASQNTNPIVLDASGSAMIWVGTPTLKLVLKDTGGTTIWTADNVPAGSSNTVCGPAYTIQFANSGASGFACDPNITINPLIHTINVGGPLPANHFSLTNLNPVVSSWTLDVTSKETHAKTGCGGTAGASKYCDGGTGDWTTLPSPGAGTVSSVAATVPAQMTISGSPITSTGTLAFGMNTTDSAATKVVTADAAGTSGNCAQWASGGKLGDAGSACALGTSSLTASGYQTFGSGLIMEWAVGVSQSVSSTTQDINFPLACPTQVFIVIPSSYASVFDDTSMPVWVVISNTLSKATVAMQRVPDHGFDASTPRIEVLCK